MSLHREYEKAVKNYELVSEEWDNVYDVNISTFMRKRNYEPTFEDIKQLRKEICLNSIYYDDYQNSLINNIDICGEENFEFFKDLCREKLNIQE